MTRERPPILAPDGHDPTLGDPCQPAPGMLVLSASRIRDYLDCPRRYFLRWIVGLAGEDFDHDGPAAIGSQTHAELRARHLHNMADHDTDGFLDEESPHDPAISRCVQAHAQLCPKDTAVYLGGELDVRWLLRGKAVLLTGRIDALWQFPDGTIEVRDYKTGNCPDSLEDDLAAAIYLLLAATALPQQPTAVRVVYESLGGETGRTVTLDGSSDHLRASYRQILDMADSIRKQRTFPASPNAAVCRTCPFRSTCPHAVRS